jgi:DNA-binding response OmpR family regulator
MLESNNGSKWVLVVEDDQVVMTLLDHMLVRRGFRVRRAVDGRQAAAIIEEVDPPSLVLLDVMLPYVDGFELMRRIRASDPWSKVPIIMLTAKSGERDVVRALGAGANDYVVKPFKPEELIARVRRFVG